MTDPEVAVVVATRNRSARLDRLLRALAEQGPTAAEVVVVDDGSTDETPAVIRRWSTAPGRSVRTVRFDVPRGAAAARNAGWRATTAPVVAFTDDDCIPAATWLADLLAAIEGADIACGRTVVDPAATHRRGAWSRTVSASAADGRYETCNIAYRRAVLEATGGFDESFGTMASGAATYGDDTDLALRAIALGAGVAAADDAVVAHDVHPGRYRDRLLEAVRLDGIVALVARHPGYRARLTFRVFVRPTHPAALAAVIGLVGLAAGRRRASLAALAPWLWLRVARVTVPGRKHWWPVTVPLTLVADLVEIVVVARSAWRRRTWLL